MNLGGVKYSVPVQNGQPHGEGSGKTVGEFGREGGGTAEKKDCKLGRVSSEQFSNRT